MQSEIDGTGLKVNPIGLGAMPLSIAGRPDEIEALAVIEAFVEVGGDFIDTANVYCLDDADIGHNERLLDRALRRIGKRDAVVIATKGGLRRPKGAWTVDGSPKWLRRSCEQSLKDLNTDTITLYQLHAVDPDIDFQASLGELIKLKEEGKILHLGLSNIDPGHLEIALRYTPIASVQNRCNPFYKKDFKNGLIALCKAKGVTYLPHSPVGGHHGHLRLPRDPLFRRLAVKYGASPYSLALAWLLHKGEHIVLIPGASKVSSVRDSAQASAIKMAQEDLAAIDRMPDG
jgi:aryl-alcohol dehydrogenase-like predicted oxidoreductase